LPVVLFVSEGPRTQRCRAVSRCICDSFSGFAYGVEPGDEAVVDAHRDDSVDLAIEPENQRWVPCQAATTSRVTVYGGSHLTREHRIPISVRT
jgi:hypothetical protein